MKNASTVARIVSKSLAHNWDNGVALLSRANAKLVDEFQDIYFSRRPSSGVD